ncbi:radical SAM family heme chaperone HemW [bacterium]|nr:radical SAM family heme chaperone HemW [bacterium]
MFGLYVHIPYCLQRCRYCDFATYVYDQILSPEKYVELLISELKAKSPLFSRQTLRSIYFGGGTPSLLDSSLILTLLDHIAKTGLQISRETEITLEINPATLNKEKISHLVSGGVNRFSVGAQTFNDSLLIDAGRKHSSLDTRQTLDLLCDLNVNYSFDLLFALPKQTLSDLEKDLRVIESYSPPHLSAYCLTVPEGHPMSFQRPHDDQQIEMFKMIESSLKQQNILRYEISNFAKMGAESKHNLLYWCDDDYVGLGLSAHSYLKNASTWGARFWNPSSIEKYQEAVLAQTKNPLEDLEKIQCLEILSEKDSLFDFCHTALRLEKGPGMILNVSEAPLT